MTVTHHNSPLSQKIDNLAKELESISVTSQESLKLNPSLQEDVIKIQASVQILSVALAEIQQKISVEVSDVAHELINYDAVISRIDSFVTSSKALFANIN